MVALSHPFISQPLNLALRAAVGFKLEGLWDSVLAPSVSSPLTLHLDTLCETRQASWGEPGKGSVCKREGPELQQSPCRGRELLIETQLDDPQRKPHLCCRGC